MKYLLEKVERLVHVPEHHLKAYLAAGYREPTAAELAAHLAKDPYNGTQGVPAASPLPPESKK